MFNQPQPIVLSPAFQDYLWGGRRLKSAYPQSNTDPLAEAWVLSNHPAGPSMLAGSTKTLPDYLAENPEALGERFQNAERFPLLVKLIDAAKPLSVQVHPGDAYALAHEGEPGKTEMWVVLDHEPGAFLYYGLQKSISKEELARRVEDDSLEEVLQPVKARRGDVFFIPAGTLHAIGAGMLIAEIQQNSNVTYRVYDYGRVGADGNPRPLHKAQALAVSTREATPLPAQPKKRQDGAEELARCPYFTVTRHTAPGSFRVTRDAFAALLVTETAGGLTLRYPAGSMPLRQYDCLLLPAGIGEIALECTSPFTALEIRP